MYKKRNSKRKLKRNLVFIIIIISAIWYWGKGIINIGVRINDKSTIVNTEAVNFSNFLINKDHTLDSGYKPFDLVVPNIPFTEESSNEEKLVSEIIKEPLENLINSALEDDIILLGNSGYRSYNTQNSLYNDRVLSHGKEEADRYVALPGISEHQTGLSIDITNQDRYFLKFTAEAEWLAENCYKFGFIIRYPEGKQNITGVEYEPWHIRYVGKEVAKYIYENNITLEEYLE